MTAQAGAAHELLQYCLAGEPWPDPLLRRAIVENEGKAFFSVVVERLGDLFEPRLCSVYAELLSRVISIVHPSWSALELLQRYERIRVARRCTQEPENVLVLSRVTLGADVAVTSVILNGLKTRFPDARIFLVGARKNWEVFAADPRIEFMPFAYPRAGSLIERLQSVPQFGTEDTMVVDPDSRLTQLGLLPVCEEDRYYFFESRSYGGESLLPLPALAAQWMSETFDISGAVPYIAPLRVPMAADVAISLGVGENPEKRIPDPFERDLLRSLTGRGLTLMVDKGAGAIESERVEHAIEGLPGIQTWSGAYAPFASMISQARLYIGYDSAGQHVAAASGTPLVSVFTGFASDRMFARWQPTGSGPSRVLKIRDCAPERVLNQTLAAADEMLR